MRINCLRCGYQRISLDQCSNQLCHGPQAAMVERSAYDAVKTEANSLRLLAVLDIQSARELRGWAIGASMYAGPIKKLCEQILEREK